MNYSPSDRAWYLIVAVACLVTAAFLAYHLVRSL
jgi:hypothetical protein